MEIIEILKVFLLALTPVGELRLAIPMAIFVYDFNPFLAYIVSLLGNLVPAILILSLLNPISDFLSRKSTLFCNFFSFLFSKTRKDHSHKIKKYGLYALVIFISIPLPITGVWTGSIIASVFGIPFKKAFPLISLGAAISGIIVLAIILAGITLEKYLNFQVLLGFILVILFGMVVYKSKKNGEITFNIFK